MLKKITQQAIIAALRPLIFREVRGWGKLYELFIGSYKRNKFWKTAGVRTIAGKLHGYAMVLNLAEWTDRSTYFLGRWYDLPTQLLAARVLSEGDVVLDIGANVGMFSLTACRCVGATGKIYAFEPNPTPRERLLHHKDLNGLSNIHVFPYALSDAPGTMPLYVPNINTGEGSLAPVNYDESDVSVVNVDVRCGDAVIPDDARPRLIKIDVEGAETGVIKGLERVIRNSRPLIIAEFIPAHLARFGADVETIWSLAGSLDYQVFKMALKRIDGRSELALETVIDPGNLSTEDLLLVHNDDPLLESLN